MKFNYLNKRFTYLRSILAIALFIIIPALHAQEIDKTRHNFGKVKDWNNPIAEFTYTNTSSHKQLFLPIAYQSDISVRFEKKELQAGESSIIYIQYFTEDFGSFEKHIPIYLNSSNEAIDLVIDGKISSFHPDAFTYCPRIEGGFAETPAFNKEIIVVDSKGDTVLWDYKLKIESSKGSYIRTVRFDDLDAHRNYQLRDLGPNLYKIGIKKEGYASTELTLYVNKNTNRIYIELTPLHPEEIIVQDEAVEQLDNEDVESPVEPEQYEVELINDSIAEIVVETTIDTSALTVDGILNDAVYSYNHMVFVIDVSASMNKDEKLPLLKYSMAEMIKVLRSEDKVTIIGYSSGVSVLADAISGSEKERLLALILSLEAKGQSHGSEALDMAYELAQAHFIEEGNNEIILASDGLFNSANFKESKVYRKAYIQFKMNDIRLSTIAFGKSKSALDFMAKSAERGGGSYLRIENELSASAILIENLMLHSRK